MTALVDKLRSGGATTRQSARAIAKGTAKGKGRPKHFQFKHQSSDKSFSLSLQFRKSSVAKDEIVAALRAIIESLGADK